VKRREKILVLDHGVAEIAFPADWGAAPEPGGHLGVTNAEDTCKLEISYLPFAASKQNGPPLADVLRNTLEVTAAGPISIEDGDRGDLWFAWADKPFDYECDGRTERAHTRTLIASNGKLYVLTTFSYWEDEATTAVAIWERMIATLHLGDGVPAGDPYAHWSVEDRKTGDR
jgi:hypothetical protein